MSEDIIKAAKKCLEDYEDRESDNIKRAEEAIRFRAGEQWPDQIKRDRENPHQQGGPRPCPVMDKTNQYVRQIINEERQNRAAIKFRPVDGNADKKVAEVLTGIVRHIEDASEALQAYTTAGEHAIDGGFGYFRIIADYCDPDSFDQDIRIKRIHNRFSVALGPHTEPDGADCEEALIWEDVPRETFKKEHPKAKEVSFKDETWGDKETLRIAEYMCIKRIPETIHLLPTGDVVTDKEFKELSEEAAEQGVIVPPPEKSRETVRKKVMWYKLTAEEVLEERELVGTYIPVVKVTGNEITMPDGKIRTSGVIEQMMDPQRLHNYAHAGLIENVALAPRAPWVAEEEQIEGYESDYALANRINLSVLKYKRISEDGHLLPPPQRMPPPGVSVGWDRIIQHTEHSIEGSAGMYGPTIGAKSQEKSGIALQEQKEQGAVGNYHFPDNLARSIQHGGRILLEWIPKYYDTERVARILGEDGEADLVKLNPNQPKAVMPELDEYEQEIGQIYNLNIGKYDVTVSTGPSYTSKRQEAAESMFGLLQARPDLMSIIGDIAFRNMDAPGADDIADRLKALLPPEVKQLEEQQGPVDPRMEAMMAQVEQSMQMIEQKAAELQQAEAEINKLAQDTKIDKSQVDSQKSALMAERRVLSAEIAKEVTKIELMGEKLLNSLEDVTDPIIRALESINIPEGEEKDNLTEALGLLAQQQEQSAAALAQSIQSALSSIAEMNQGLVQTINQPRQTEIQYDEMGNPIGAVSRVG